MTADFLTAEETKQLLEALRACAKEMGRVHNAHEHEDARMKALEILKAHPETKTEG